MVLRFSCSKTEQTQSKVCPFSDVYLTMAKANVRFLRVPFVSKSTGGLVSFHWSMVAFVGRCSQKGLRPSVRCTYQLLNVVLILRSLQGNLFVQIIF